MSWHRRTRRPQDLPMKETTCYCCGAACYANDGSIYTYVCRSCANEISGNTGNGDPKDGNGYPLDGGVNKGWVDKLDAVKARKMGTTSSASTYSVGMKCCRCGDYNDYGASNQSDGKYKCYRCRS